MVRQRNSPKKSAVHMQSSIPVPESLKEGNKTSISPSIPGIAFFTFFAVSRVFCFSANKNYYSNLRADPVLTEEQHYLALFSPEGGTTLSERLVTVTDKPEVGASNKNLVAFNALGRANKVPLVEHARRSVFIPDEWDCVAFTFAEEDQLPDDDQHLVNLKELNCTIIRTPSNFWGDFLHFLPPTFVNHYEYVALVLDDIFFPVQGDDIVNVTKLIQNMQIHNIDVIQPGIVGDTHGYIQKGIHNNLTQCIAEVHFIETYVQLFNSAAWECFYKMLHYSGSRGWCYDLCFKYMCPHLKLGQDFSMKAWHIDKKNKQLPKDRLNGTDLADWVYFPKQDLYSEYNNLEKRAICGRYECPTKKNPKSPLNFMGKIVCPEDRGEHAPRAF